MKTLAVAAAGMLALAGCVTVNLPEIPPYHPGYAQAEPGALAPAPPILDLNTAPPVASPSLPVPGPSDMEHGTMPHMEQGQGAMKQQDTENKAEGSAHEGMKHEGRSTAPKAGGSGESKVIYTCPMHPEVVSDRPGTCPKCGMTLQKKEVQK